MALALSVTQPTPSCSEHELVAAVRSGDDRAFEELYARYRSRIGSYIFGMVGDYGRAEDIAQEVFISALRRLRDTERPIAFKPWIYEIAKNACIDEFRRTRRAQEISLSPDDESEGPVLLSSAPTPELAVESKQRLDDLRGAFRGLSDNHHQIIVLREFEGLSYGEIAARMGMSRPMVESTLFRARRRLSEEYEELVSGRRCEHVQSVIETSGGRTIRSLGIRERRQLSRHLSHCQPCRRHARMAGVDESAFTEPKVARKLAALLPLPWIRWRRGASEQEAASDVAARYSHQLIALQSLPTIAKLTDPMSSSVAGVGRAAAAAAAIALAGIGGGVAARMSDRGVFGGSAGQTTSALHGGARSTATAAPGGAGGGIGGSMGNGDSTGSGGPSAAASPSGSSGVHSQSSGGTPGLSTISGGNQPAINAVGAPTVPKSPVNAPATPRTPPVTTPPVSPPSTPQVNTPGPPQVSSPQVSSPQVGSPPVNPPQVSPPPVGPPPVNPPSGSSVGAPILPGVPTIGSNPLGVTSPVTVPAVTVPQTPAVPSVPVPPLH